MSVSPSDAPDRAVTVSKEVAMMSVTIANMLDDFGGATDVPIPLHNVSSAILAKVVADAPAPEDKDKAKSAADIGEWDKAFCNVDQATLFELILAANYLDIKTLLDLGCKTVAKMIKGKNPEEIRTIFHISNDFTPEEEEQVRKDNEWCEER